MTNPQEDPRLSSYVIDAENVAEMARLTKQAQMMTKYTGLLPPGKSLHDGEKVLDIGTGPGEWILTLARQFPACYFHGLDISDLMTRYAAHLAEEEQLSHVQFHIGDARGPLSFPDASFDFIHARLVTTFLSPHAWPGLLAECYRLLRPGGTFFSTEGDNIGITTAPTLAHYNTLLVEAVRRAGNCFAPEGTFFGITAVQKRLFKEAGFVAIEQQAHAMNYSAGEEVHIPGVEDLTMMLKLLQPFLIATGVTTQEEVSVLYERALAEMDEEDFCGVIFFQSTWGKAIG